MPHSPWTFTPHANSSPSMVTHVVKLRPQDTANTCPNQRSPETQKAGAQGGMGGGHGTYKGGGQDKGSVEMKRKGAKQLPTMSSSGGSSSGSGSDASGDTALRWWLREQKRLQANKYTHLTLLGQLHQLRGRDALHTTRAQPAVSAPAPAKQNALHCTMARVSQGDGVQGVGMGRETG
jgi:hypothetical protein